ncbi:MAG TPA: hypothetical protein VGQ62_04750 [Chloroflexota bacterium]|nr:hypothetical protein [Chloroflexota bacterium]
MDFLTSSAGLDDLAQAMAHWLEAAAARGRPGDRAASSEALHEAARRLLAHQDRQHINPADTGLFHG